MPGPVPKRSDQRRRENKTPGLEKASAGSKPRIPSASKNWHPTAKRWWASLKVSGQSEFYEQSDWAQGYFAAEIMSGILYADKPSAPMVAQFLSISQELLVTEGARRRARLELMREDPEAAPELNVVDLNARFGG